ncbi:MAG: S8 family peptidase [Herbinix sp.]|nr:S8 family peptidase [Herbinix sp.]
MTGEGINNYMGEDYADFIVDYRTNPRIAELFPGAAILDINNTYAIIYLPVSQFANRMMRGIRLLIVPNVYGLASEVSLEASGVQKIRSMPDFNLRGEGVLIGIIDTGINYTLPAFKKENGTTKIRSIWDQTIKSVNGAQSSTNFGTEYKEEQINQALQNENPLTVVPSTDEDGHGTMLAGIAAGTENSTEGFYGVAPEAELVIVKLAQAKKYLREFYSIPEGVICYQENYIMWGVQYCLDVARQLERPIAICIGVGTSQSGHDGTAPLSELLNMYADFPRVGIVTAIGNEGNLGRHYYGTIDPAVGNTSLEFNVGENDKGFSMQLWGEAPGIFSIDILSPSGEYIPRISAGLQVSRRISFIFEQTIINVEYQTVEPRTGDELILLNFHNTTPGVWKITVYGQGNLVGNFHIWLPMGNFISKDTYFIKPNIYTTVVAPGDAVVPISVTAYNPVGDSLYANASRGYTRTNTIKPELAAPGVNYLAPTLDGGYTNFTGTGVASAHTAGIVALLLEWGVVRGNQQNIDTLEIKKYLIRGAKRSSNLTYPNRDWGYGILDIYNAFDVLRSSV